MAFLNSDFYGKSDRANLLSIMYESNRPIHKGQVIIEDVLRFMFTTELHQLSGLSFLDLMELDSYTYSLVKKIYEEVEQPKREALAQLQKDLQNQANSTNTSNHAFSKAPRRKHERPPVRKSKRY